MTPPVSSRTTVALFATASALLTLTPRPSEACGCFAPPNPSVPIVQAGERIVFAHEDGKVIAHIQIQYQGEAKEFGWLLPLPSVPTMKLGTEELFTQILAATQPRYRLTRVANDQCLFVVPGGGRFNGAPTLDAGSAEDGGGGGAGPLVIEDSIGPYDYAVLKADSQEEMVNWLKDNRYFIPTGTESVVGPYIRPGAFFLALKLRKGNDAGDIQPVVLEYPSDLPMIPIILTSVAATPDMGVQVWVLGESRAIPRNYRHTILNEEHIDWFNAGANYAEVIINATNEAPNGQAFVTEYAGSTAPMQGVLDWDQRFGRRLELEAIEDPTDYAVALQGRGFPDSSNYRNTLKRHYNYPGTLADQGIDEEAFYRSLGYYLSYYRERNPQLFEGYEVEVNTASVTEDLWERVVTPTLEAGALFSTHSKMTRMLTTLSPEEMTRDPVFSWNPDLPDVSNEHEATFEYVCDDNQNGPNDTPGILELADGRRFYVANQAGWANPTQSEAPYSRRIEVLREEGMPVVELDNDPILRFTGDEGGCTCADPDHRSSPLTAGLLLVGLAVLSVRRKR